MKRKELELEMQLFEQNGAQNLEYQKEAIDIQNSDSDDDAAPSIRSRSSFIGKETRNRGLTDQINLKMHTTITVNNLKMNQRTHTHEKLLMKIGHASQDHQVESVTVQHRVKKNLCMTKHSGSSQLPKLKLSSLDGDPFECPEWSSTFVATYRAPT